MNNINSFVTALDQNYENGENILVYLEDDAVIKIIGPDGDDVEMPLVELAKGATPSRHFLTLANGHDAGMRLVVPMGKHYGFLTQLGEPVSLKTKGGQTVRTVWLANGTTAPYDPRRHVYSPHWGVWVDIFDGDCVTNAKRPEETSENPEDFAPGITVVFRRDVFPKEDIRMIEEAFGAKIKAFVQSNPLDTKDGVVRIQKEDEKMTIQIDQIWARQLISMMAQVSMTYGKILALMAVEIPTLNRVVKSFKETANGRVKQLRELTKGKKSEKTNF